MGSGARICAGEEGGTVGWRRTGLMDRSSTGTVVAGLFLVLALAGLVGLRLLGPQAGPGRRAPGEITPDLVWERPLAPGTRGGFTPAGLILLIEPRSSGTGLRVMDVEGHLLATRDLGDADFCLPAGGREAVTAYFLLRARPRQTADAPYGETVRLETPGGSCRWQYAVPGGVVLAAASTTDAGRSVLAVLQLDRDRPEGHLHLLDAAGELTARFNLEAGAIHRLVLGAEGYRVAAADPRALHYLDAGSGRLWTRIPRGELRDVALLSHGGPVVLTAVSLQAYDGHGRLLWSRLLEAPGLALATFPGGLIASTRAGLTAYREDGRRLWNWPGAPAARSVSLCPDGTSLLVVDEAGTVSLHRLPGTAGAGIATAFGEDAMGGGP